MWILYHIWRQMWHANDKKSVGRNSPADYEGKRCSAVSYSTGKLGKTQGGAQTSVCRRNVNRILCHRAAHLPRIWYNVCNGLSRKDIEVVDRALALLLAALVVGCASEKALDHGCATTVSRANTVRVSAAVFDKAVYDAASQAELIAKFRNHEVALLWSHIVTPDGGAVSSIRNVRVVSVTRSRGSGYSSSSSSETSRDVGERIKIVDAKDGTLRVQCHFSSIDKAKSEEDEDVVYESKIEGTVPVGAGDSVIGSVRANASGSSVIVIFVNQ